MMRETLKDYSSEILSEYKACLIWTFATLRRKITVAIEGITYYVN